MQPDLFNARPVIHPIDSRISDPVEQRRLSGQAWRIVERLRQGPATNRELAQIALKYTSRLSDCRAAGYVIENYDHDTKTGLS